MAQGLNLKDWDSDKSPSTDAKVNETVKRTRAMGSRRMFPPQFKLQVLDSYRNDLDCRGNQRATARKYNIHRRQIQKWLQCEQNLRTCVEESAKNDEIKFSESAFHRIGKKCDLVKNNDGKMDTALNRSAMIYARLNDAERTIEENAVRPTPQSETKVYRDRDSMSVKLEAQNLKRVAQKLYPSSRRHLVAPVDGIQRIEPEFDDNFNRIGCYDEVPLDLISKSRSEESVPKECLMNESKTNSLADAEPDKLKIDGNLFSNSVLLKENVERQKLCDSNAVPKCLVQKYTNDSEGQKFNAGDSDRSELLCSAIVNSTESSCLLDVQVPVTSNSVPYSSGCLNEKDRSFSLEKIEPAADVSLENVPIENRANSPFKKVKNDANNSKSFNPKRKWIEESMLEMGEEEKSAQSLLPIKKRVQMNLKTVPEEESSPSVRKGVSPNFTIERLCSSDIKTEKVTPTSFHSPDSDYWRADNYVDVSPVSHHPHAVLPFPPPLILPHRVIPDLVSLHFKPEGFDLQKTACNLGIAGGCSYDDSVIDIPLKEEKVSDAEESVDVDILSTTPVEKKTFDFSGYNVGKRRSFSVQFKLTVLDAFYNDKDCNKNQRATARKFNINRRQVQKWLSQENDLRSEGSLKNGKYLQRQRLGNEKEAEVADACMQCPQHCLKKKREAEEMDKSIEVNVKHCSDNQCLSRNKSNPDNGKTHLNNESFDYYGKNNFNFQSDLKSANIYDNFLIPDSNNLIYHDSFLGWPNLNASALPVPNFQYMSPWYHNYDYCHEKAKIY